MNLIKLSLIAVFFNVVSFSAQAQNVKPKFKKFVYVTYRTSDTGNKKTIRPEVIMELNSEGILHRFFNIYFDNSANLSLNNAILGGDTIYRVSDSLISKLNKVFEYKPNLVQPTEFRNQHKKQEYYGPYMFISFTDSNGSNHNLVIADLFDVNVEFRKILVNFLHERSKMNRGNEPLVRDGELEETILKYHSNCKNLPQLKFINNLEVKDPLIKN
jgi:hypothetical protein